mmetsp:Transcript_512/g.768  ORF Transcript_512/g.768 Transcript_512/m.768 type:complete len:95 (+) Transcript_512:1392-1676(+)
MIIFSSSFPSKSQVLQLDRQLGSIKAGFALHSPREAQFSQFSCESPQAGLLSAQVPPTHTSLPVEHVTVKNSSQKKSTQRTRRLCVAIVQIIVY